MDNTRDDPPSEQEPIGHRIRRLRLARGLSQRALTGPGVSYAYVSRIESGQRDPSLKAIRTIAARLDVDPELIETGELIPAAKRRTLRVAEAELALRLERGADDAERVLTETVEARRDDVAGVRALAALGLLAARRGATREAIALLEEAISTGLVRPELRTDVFEQLADLHATAGHPGRAIELLRECVAAVAGRGAPEAVTAGLRYRVFLAEHLNTMGAHEEARALLAEATEAADSSENASARIVAYWTAAKVAMDEGEHETADVYMQRAVALIEATDDALQLARASLAWAQILRIDGRPDDAAPHLARAERLLGAAGDVEERGLLAAEQAQRAALLGEPEEAIQRARFAVSLLGDDARHAATAQHALAVAHVAAGNVKAADAAFKAALAGMESRRRWREATSVARDWARLLRRRGREKEAHDVLERAVSFSVRSFGPQAAETKR
jgi:transcriptional regulator with XRE-family HTH domain